MLQCHTCIRWFANSYCRNVKNATDLLNVTKRAFIQQPFIPKTTINQDVRKQLQRWFSVAATLSSMR